MTLTHVVEFTITPTHCLHVSQLVSVTAPALLLTGIRTTLIMKNVGFIHHRSQLTYLQELLIID